MSTPRLAGLVIVAALVAAGVWLALGIGPGAMRDGELAVSAGLRPEIADLPIQAPSAGSRAPHADSGPGRETLASAPEQGAGEDEAVLEAEAPLLVGRVVDAEARPITGARVWAVTGASWVLAPLDVEVHGLSNWLEPQQVETDDEGRFAFEDGLEPGSLRLAVRVAGHGPLYLEGRQLADRRPHDVGDLVLQPGVRLEGKVVDRRGEGVEGALILQSVERGLAGMRISMPGRGVPLGRTGAGGRFVLDSIAEGPWSLIVDADGYRVYEERGRTAAAGDVQDGLLFVLERGEAIHGSVRGLQSGLHARLRIEARPKGDGNRGSSSEEAAESASRRVRRSNVDSDSGFRIDGLQSAVEYTLTAWEREEDVETRDTGEWKRQRSIESAAAFSGARVELEFAPEASITFRVVDGETGAAVERYVVWAGVADRLRTQPGAGENDSAMRDHPDGRGTFDGLRPGRGGAQGKIQIRAVGYKDLERANIALVRGEEADLGDLVLERAPHARITVLDAESGEPVEGAHVLLGKENDEDSGLQWFLKDPTREAWGSRGIRFGVTDANGKCAVPLIDGEWCKLHVVSTEYVASDPIDVPARSAADVEHTVRLARGGAVIVTVRSPAGDPIADAKVGHRLDGTDEDVPRGWRGGQEAGTPTDPEGVARFEHLQPGDYSFRVMPEGQNAGGIIFNNRSAEPKADEGWSAVRVVEGGSAELELIGTARASLLGVLTESRVGLAGANLNLQPKGGQPQYSWGGANKYQALSEHDGRFAFRDLAAGDYTLVVTHGERRMSYSEDLTLAPGENALDVELPLAIIEGRVVDPDGLPIPGLEVRVSTMARQRGRGFGGGTLSLIEDDKGSLRPDWSSTRRRNARTGSDGAYALRGVTTSDKLRVSVSGSYVVSGSVEDIVVAPDEIRGGVDFVLERAGRMRIRLQGAQRGQYNVQALLTRGDETFTRNTRVWGTRSARIGPCRAGTWKLTLKVRQNDEWKVVTTTTADVRVGESTSVTIEVP